MGAQNLGKKSIEYDIPWYNMGCGYKGVLEQSCKKQNKISNQYASVSGIQGKPTYVDIPNNIVDTMKQMYPQDVSNILLSKEK